MKHTALFTLAILLSTSTAFAQRPAHEHTTKATIAKERADFKQHIKDERAALKEHIKEEQAAFKTQMAQDKAELKKEKAEEKAAAATAEGGDSQD